MMKLQPLCMAAIAAMLLTACRPHNLGEAVKNMAAEYVDTTGYNSRTVALDSFRYVAIECFADVTYVQTPAGSQPRIEIKAPADLLPLIEPHVSPNGRLAVGLRRNYAMNDQAMPAIRIEAPDVESFDLIGGKCLRLNKIHSEHPVKLTLSGVGVVMSSDITVPQLDITLNGAGSFDLRGINTELLNATLNGAGYMSLQGRATRVHKAENGAGTIHTEQLKN